MRALLLSAGAVSVILLFLNDSIRERALVSDADALVARELLAEIEPQVEHFIRSSGDRLQGYGEGLDVGVGSQVGRARCIKP